MSKGRVRGKRAKQQPAKAGRDAAIAAQVLDAVRELTGTMTVELDNTVPGGVRWRHDPAHQNGNGGGPHGSR